MHVEPDKSVGSGGLIEAVQVPVLKVMDGTRTWVEGGTVGVVVLAFLWLAWVLSVKSGKGVEGKEKKVQ